MKILTFFCIFLLTSNSDGDAEYDQAEDQEDDGPGAGELWADTGHFPAIAMHWSIVRITASNWSMIN